jgi:hypothetical protein
MGAGVLVAHYEPVQRKTMRFRDGVLDVVGNCRRSATPNALLKS